MIGHVYNAECGELRNTASESNPNSNLRIHIPHSTFTSMWMYADSVARMWRLGQS